MNKLQIILKNLQNLAENEDFTFERLYRLFYNKDLYYKALAKLYSNQGIATPGVDGETIDGISEEKIDRIIETLRDESYQPKPAKRVYISILEIHQILRKESKQINVNSAGRKMFHLNVTTSINSKT